MKVYSSSLFVLFVALAIPAIAAPPLREAGSIPLPGVEGRIDHLAVSPDGGRLFVAALGNNTVEVIDLKTRQRVASIKGPQEPQGVRVIPSIPGTAGGAEMPASVAVASGSDSACRFYALDGMKLLATVPDLDDADNVRYDEGNQRVYVGYGSGKSAGLAMLDPRSRKLVASIALPGHPESFQLDPRAHRVYVNVPTSGAVAVIDSEQRKVVATWPITDARSNFPMALDAEHHRLFIVCRRPARLLAIDTDTGRAVANVPCVGDADDVFYAADTKRLYITGGEGHVSTFTQDSPDRYTPLDNTPTAPGARTSLYVPASGMLYVAVPRHGGHGAEIRIFTAGESKDGTTDSRR